MQKPLFKFEEGLLRVEKWTLVICVLLMLAIAGYTVFYRNILIPWQSHLAASGPPVSEEVEQVEDAPDEAGDEPAEDEADDQGFGGGFGGGFDDAQPDEQAEQEVEDEADEEGFGGGFGGGFGDAQPEASEETEESEESEKSEAPPQDVAEDAREELRGGPPEEGSFAARMVELIDDLKFHWLDVLLRQLVILSGFLGAMLATRQRSHITVDAVGKLLEGRTEHVVHTVTSIAAAVVCVFLALSGWELVAIGLEFPRQLIPWLDNWHFQLAFPIGWGLLSFHFAMRALESATLAIDEPEADTPHSEPHEEVV